jgi:hypothetical protein
MMKLLNLGGLLMLPAFLFAQEPTRVGIETHAVDSPPDSAKASVPLPLAPDPLTVGQKVKRRALRLVEPVSLFSSAFGSGIEQLRDMPPQWGQGAEGYGRRFASAEGYTAAHNTLALGFDIAFHLDPRYRRMPEAGVGQRLWNAVSQTFIANTDSGGKMINVSEIAGNFGAGFVSNAWQPPGYRSSGDALTRAAFGLAYHTAKNAAREFVPDLLHHVRHQPSEKSPD